MIDLKVGSYCHNCPEFEADVKKENFVAEGFDDIHNGEVYIIERTITNTRVTCKHRIRCLGMVEYLKGVIKRESEDDTRR